MVWNIVSYIYLLFASIIAVPLTLNGLGSADYARYLVVTGIAAIFISLDLGIPATVVRAIARSNTHSPINAFRTSLFITLVLGVLVSLGGYLILLLTNNTAIFSLNSHEVTSVAIALASYIFVNYLISLISSVPQGREDFAIFSIRALISGTGNTFLAAITAIITHDLVSVLWVQTYSACFAAFLLIIYALSHYGFKLFIPLISRKEGQGILNFGLPVQISNLAPQLQANLSKIISTAFLSITDLSSLGIAQSLTFKSVGIIGQITSAFFPTVARLAHQEVGRLRSLVKKLSIGFVILAIITALTVNFFGVDILTWWLGDIALARVITQVLLIYCFFVMVLSPAAFVGTVLTARGYPWIVSFFSWIQVILELSLMFILIKFIGVKGVPLSAFIAQAIITPLFLLKARKILK